MKDFFTLKHIKGDVLGGITAGIVAIPLALAFGVSSGLGPSAGLYGAIFLSFFAALFGGTNTQISGPTAPMTAVSMIVIATIIASKEGDVGKALPIILTIFLLVGILQIGLGALGLGKYIKYIPYPVVSGFMTAIGLIIIITQLIPMIGYYPKNDAEYINQYKVKAETQIFKGILEKEAGENIYVLEDYKETVKKAELVTQEDINKEAVSIASKESSGVMGAVKTLPRALKNINWLELSLALSTIAIIYGFKRITTVVPSTLVALLLVSGVAYFFHLDYITIEAIPAGFPVPIMEIFTGFKLDSVTPFIFTAISLAILGAIDSLLTSVVADNMTKTSHRPNRELIGQGIGNSLSAIFGGLPGAGATIRTVVNINSGGRTKLSGMIAALFILLVVLALSTVASKIPAAVLAGILLTVGISVIDYKGIKVVKSMPTSEVIIMIVVLLLSTFWNLVYAVGIGLVIASLMFMKKIGDLTAQNSEVVKLSDKDIDRDEDLPEDEKKKIFIKQLEGPLFFGSTSDFQNMTAQIPETATIMIIRMTKVPYIDQSGAFAMEDVIKQSRKSGRLVLISGLQEQPSEMLHKLNIIPGLVPEDNNFFSFRDCVAWIRNEHLV